MWDPSGKGKTKLYASAGRFYWSIPTDLSVFAFPVVLESTYNFDPVDKTQDPAVLGHPGAFTFVGGGGQADRNLKGVYQDELTMGIETLLDPTLSVGVRGIYRRLGRAIENRCDLDPTSPENDGSGCATLNPGSDGKYARGDFYGCNGLDDPFSQCQQGEPPTPDARRLYRGIELLARKTVGERFWLQASYVYSSLRGNYDGGVDESSGETNPGASADFDFPPYWSHNAYGKLYLDRPHSFPRADASYTAPFRLFIGVQGFVQSGAPLNKLGISTGTRSSDLRFSSCPEAGRDGSRLSGRRT